MSPNLWPPKTVARILRNIYRQSQSRNLCELVMVLGPLADELDAAEPMHPHSEVLELRAKIAELYDRIDNLARQK